MRVEDSNGAAPTCAAPCAEVAKIFSFCSADQIVLSEHVVQLDFYQNFRHSISDDWSLNVMKRLTLIPGTISM